MLVAEFIAHLSQFPADARVMVRTYAAGTDHTYDYDASRVTLEDGEVILEAEDN